MDKGKAPAPNADASRVVNPKTGCLSRGLTGEAFFYFFFLLFRKAKKVSTCSDVVYVYKNNPYGMTSTTKTKPKALDTFWITELCVKEYVSRGFGFDGLFIRKLRNQFIVNCKRMSVFDDSIQ